MYQLFRKRKEPAGYIIIMKPSYPCRISIRTVSVSTFILGVDDVAF